MLQLDAGSAWLGRSRVVLAGLSRRPYLLSYVAEFDPLHQARGYPVVIRLVLDCRCGHVCNSPAIAAVRRFRPLIRRLRQ